MNRHALVSALWCAWLSTSALAVHAQAAAVATPPSASAESSAATAVSLAKAQQWPQALAAIDDAIADSPNWPDAYFVRAGINEVLAPDSSLDALVHADRRSDIASVAAHLEVAAADLERYLVLVPSFEDRSKVVARIGDLRARALAARNAKAVHERALAEQAKERERTKKAAEAARAAEARAEAKRAAEQRAAEAKRAAAEARAEAKRAAEQRAAEVESKRHAPARRRRIGYIVAGVGVAAGIASAVFAGMGAGVNSDIRSGGFATFDDLDERFDDGRTYNIVSWVALGTAGVGLAVGLPLILLNPDESDARVRLEVKPSGTNRTPGMQLALTGDF